MAKERIYRPRLSSADIRRKIRFYYTEKFYNKWMSKYEFVGLDYQQSHYIMKKFWSLGTICASKIGAKVDGDILAEMMDGGLIDMGSASIVFTDWTTNGTYNIYDYPTGVKLINKRNVKFINANAVMELDKDAVIGYAQKNHKSVFSSIEAKLDEIVDIEMKKRVARKAQSQPWMFAFSPEDFDQAKILQEQMEADEPYMFVPLNDVDRAKGLTSGAPYIVDKLEQERQKAENDILTIMGVNNVGIGEKKEHLTVDEVNANNEDVEENDQSFQSEIEEFFDRVYKVLGYKVTVKDAYVPEGYGYQEENEDDADEED